MKKILLIIISAFICFSHTWAQGIRDNTAKKITKVISRDTQSDTRPSRPEAGFITTQKITVPIKAVDTLVAKKDTVYLYSNPIDSLAVAYYANVTKKNGWMVGVGKKLSLREAQFLNHYYKLSLKNYAGNWTFMEAYNGYGDLTPYHSVGTYLVNQFDGSDKGANEDWRQRLLTVCRWEFIGDPSGQNVIQERAMDSDGNIVYVYNPVQISKNVFTGTYTDRWGMPIFMRTDSLGNDIGYANFVHVHRDERGFDIRVAYSDRNGIPQINKDGAYMVAFEYDDDGHKLKEASMNIVGGYMTDSWGNCGWKAEFQDGNQVKASYFDSDGKIMRMPTLREGSQNVYSVQYEYDEHGRNTEMYYTDADGRPDVNQYGVHKVKVTYNDHGSYTSKEFYDLTGNLCDGNSSGVAKEYFEFDSTGIATLIEFRNSKGQYVVNEGYNICKRTTETRNGTVTSQSEYIVDPKSGQLIQSFQYNNDGKGNTTRKWFQENVIVTDLVDDQGRTTLHARYDLNNNPINDSDGIHKRTYEYRDSVTVEQWFNKYGSPALCGRNQNRYSKSIQIIDEKKCIMTNYQYLYGNLRQSFQKKFSTGFERILSQWDITPYGEHARVGWWDNLHYVCDVDYDLHGSIRTMVGRNEFGEPSYLTMLTSDPKVYHFLDFNNDNECRYYDEKGIQIPEGTMQKFMERLPKAFCIEVLDPLKARIHGFRNGDIIISYGNWKVHEDLNTNIYNFYLETILSANISKQMVVLRHHPDKSYSEIVTCDLPSGETSALGFYPHMIYYTQKEKQRLLDTCADNKIKLETTTSGYSKSLILAVPVKGGFETTTIYHHEDVKDPAVLLGSEKSYRNKVEKWDVTQPTSDWKENKFYYSSGSSLVVTHNLSEIRQIQKKSIGYDGMRFIPIKVSAEVYDNVLLWYLMQNPDEKKSNGSSIESMIQGVWKTDIEGFNINLTINENNTWDVTFSIDFLDDTMSATILILNKNTGKWYFDGSKISLNEKNIELVCQLKDLQSSELNNKLNNKLRKELEKILLNDMKELLPSLGEYFINLELTLVKINELKSDDDVTFTKVQ